MQSNADMARELIAHENIMLNHRMNWFLVLQGFMLAGVAFGWEKSVALCAVFCSIGILSSISVGILLRYSIFTIKRLEEPYKDMENSVIGRGHKKTHPLIHFLLPWHFLPILFMSAWVALLLVKCL